MNGFSYKNWIVWQKGMQLVKQVYTISEKLPKGEECNLKSQIRRAAVSIVSNIAEGSARKSVAERRRFYEVARSSALEVDAQLEVCILLHYLPSEQCNEMSNLMAEPFRMLTKMIDG